jgi:hypothetical protein
MQPILANPKPSNEPKLGTIFLRSGVAIPRSVPHPSSPSGLTIAHGANGLKDRDVLQYITVYINYRGDDTHRLKFFSSAI